MGLSLAIAFPVALPAQTNAGGSSPESNCKVYFLAVWVPVDSSSKPVRLMSENQTQWWIKKGAKKYRELCDWAGPGSPLPRYAILWRVSSETFTFNAPVLDLSTTTVSGDVNAKAQTYSLHMQPQIGSRQVVGVFVYTYDGKRSAHLVYALRRAEDKPDKKAFEAAVKWIADTAHLRKSSKHPGPDQVRLT